MMPPSHHILSALQVARDNELTLAGAHRHSVEPRSSRGVSLPTGRRFRRGLARLHLAPLRQA